MEARQGKARQGKARQGKARQGKARQGKARQASYRALTSKSRTPHRYARVDALCPQRASIRQAHTMMKTE